MNETVKNSPTYHFKLFLAGNEANSAHARQIVTDLCETRLKGKFNLEIIDVYENYQEALDNKIVVVPTLKVQSPEMNIAVSGSLKSTSELAKILGLSIKKVRQ